MSVFSNIMTKIFSAAESVEKAVMPEAAAAPTASPTPAAPATMPGSSPAPAAAPAPTATSTSSPPVDVEKVLSDMAAQKGGGGNWQTSIVDLLKLLDLDSSLTARKELANELDVHVGADGSAEENIALHKGVMQKLAENGGKVPAGMMG